MKVLIVGGGGREHALAWKIAQSPRVEEVLCAPGNAGIASAARCIDIRAEQVEALVDFAVQEGIGLTVVGPEVPLTMGCAPSGPTTCCRLRWKGATGRPCSSRITPPGTWGPVISPKTAEAYTLIGAFLTGMPTAGGAPGEATPCSTLARMPLFRSLRSSATCPSHGPSSPGTVNQLPTETGAASRIRVQITRSVGRCGLSTTRPTRSPLIVETLRACCRPP